MFRRLLVAFLLLPVRYALSQVVLMGNEWINYQQTYVKIPIAQNGLYRINAADLQRAGVPVNLLNPSTIQIFHRGVEQAINVAGETDGRFDAGDFVEFYGRSNDGALDSLLYSPGKAQPNPYYSLFSDTTTYFLTWRLDRSAGADKRSKRMAIHTDEDFGTLTPEPYHWAEERRVFTQTYSAGAIYPLGAGYGDGAILTGYDTGEGWTGPIVKTGQPFDQTFTLTNWVASADVAPRISYQFVGRSTRLHRVSVEAGPSVTALRLLGTQSFGNYDNAQVSAELAPTDATPSGQVLLTIRPTEEADEVSVSSLTLRYPQRTNVGGAIQKELHVRANPAGRSRLDLTNVPADARLFDINDPANVGQIGGQLTNGRWQGVVRNSQKERTLLLTSQPMAVPAIIPVTFRRLDNPKANYLIVTHPLLRQAVGNVPDPVRAYAAYRASEAGGRYDTLTVDIGQLFDQFSYGERHPLAIRRFADYVLRTGDSGPKFLFLIGQSRDPQGIRKAANGALLDLVPNAGWPGSDLGLVAGLNGEPAHVPALPIGRLNAIRSQQVLDYLDKVREHEDTTEPALWRKNVLHLSGGRNRNELLAFRRFVDDFKAVIETKSVGGRVTTLSKQTDNPVESLPVANLVNQGFGMLSMFGHSSLDVADIDIGFVSNDRLGYRNKGRYPFLLANGCAAGNFYFGRPTFGADWILTPNRGAVLFMAHTHNGFPFSLKNYSDQLYALLADSQYVARPLALLQQEAIRRYLKADTSIYAITTAQQMTLQGDPAVPVFPFAKADLAVAPGSLRLRGNRGDSLTNQSDSVLVTGILLNYGRVTNSPLTVRIRRYGATGQLIREQRFTQSAPLYADSLQWRLPNDQPTGISYVELLLDPDDRIAESRETNNRAEVSTLGAVESLPFPPDLIPPLLDVAFDGRRIGDGDVVSGQAVIDVLLQDENQRLLRTDTTGLELYLQRPCPTGNCPYERLSLRGHTVQWTAASANNAFRLRYQPTTPLPDGRYAFEAVGHDLSGNRAAPYRIHFTVKNQPEITNAATYPNPFGQQTRFAVTVTGQTPPASLAIRISDLTGRVVRTLTTTARVGLNEWFWDGTSDGGVALPAGIYVYTIVGVDRPVMNGLPMSGRIILNR